ncbi:MAG TPA: Rieske 2Fe-2S domain-containing protein [Actinomycetota bacterium]|jgi:ubiquinol-cytochrome c reductase iron-sulfur subunit|nr:Rieske 2Fe-2S domain-containing protein [Actinomycetota bacterium]
MRASRVVGIAFGLSILASLGWIVVYALEGGRLWEGVTLGTALGALGFGIVVWADRLLDSPEQVEERHILESSEAEQQVLEDTLVESAGEITRRRMLLGGLAAAGGVLGAALVAPVLSFGRHPNGELFTTKWYKGARLVGYDGLPIKPEDVPFEGAITVFPEGHLDSGDSMTMLLRVEPGRFRLPSGRQDWVVDGCAAYSKVCTHAGCPVALFRSTSGELVCPCHQSTFDVLGGGNVTFGPAGRPLPMLPIEKDEEGYLVARGDYPEVVGPSFWDITHRD